jgi:LL-diaminopimelate aminotransferase
MMEITFSNRMKAFSPSIFSELSQYRNDKLSQGIEMIDLSIGTPDLPPPPFLVHTLAQEASDCTKYGYPLTGTKKFHQTVCDFYDRKYSVKLHADKEIVQLMGSQDGLVHLPMVLADPGDYILVPDPGYTAYATGIAMAGAFPYFMPLKKENYFLPDFSLIPEEVARQTKLMILNFPGNPIPAIATRELFQEAIAFAKKYSIVILHDFAYSELYYSDEPPISFLSIEGAKEVGIEMNSLSKSFSMAGCRIGYASGNEKIIQALQQFKSNLDYGVFFPIQEAGIQALKNGDSFCEETRRIYKARRDALVDGCNKIGWSIEKPKAGMFVWAEIPKEFTSKEFAYALMDEAQVVVTPGNAFGPSGEGYVRIALVQSEEIIKQAVKNIAKSGLFSITVH